MTDHRPRRGVDNDRWYHPFRSTSTSASPEWAVSVTDALNDWAYTSLRIAVLSPGAGVRHALEHEEAIVVPLVGSCQVEASTGGAEPDTYALGGRPSVFSGPTDTLYLPAGRSLSITNPGGGEARVAVCGARVDEPTDRDPVLLAAEDVPVELRGAGTCSREVRNFGVPDVLDADRIIACEVLTPAGGWSSYPPHKHDEYRPGEEAELEEIYYFETQAVGDAASGRVPVTRGTDRGDGRHPVGYQQVYGGGERAIDVLVEVTTGDVVRVPHGWHGPAMAAPDADLYYLNVMAGPGPERMWLICDDPTHSAIRDTWDGLPVDPRLPFGGTRDDS